MARVRPDEVDEGAEVARRGGDAEADRRAAGRESGAPARPERGDDPTAPDPEEPVIDEGPTPAPEAPAPAPEKPTELAQVPAPDAVLRPGDVKPEELPEPDGLDLPSHKNEDDGGHQGLDVRGHEGRDKHGLGVRGHGRGHKGRDRKDGRPGPERGIRGPLPLRPP
jgi:hypothetical protein